MKKPLPLLLFVAILFAGFYFLLYPKLGIITGYTAKIMCSCRYVSNIPEDTAHAIDLGFGPLFLASVQINDDSKTVTSSVLGMQRKNAVYRPGLGCTLLPDNAETPAISSTYHPKNVPLQRHPLYKSRHAQLKKAVAPIFSEHADIHTRAVVILEDGKLIYEQYTPGIDKDSRLLGWSMSKSVTSALAGILIRQNRWQLDSALAIKAWQSDARQEITLKNALRMNTGLLWEEDYSDVSDATLMLYNESSMGAYAASKPLKHAPGSRWLYSSGTTNLLAWAMKAYFPGLQEYLQFPQRELFGPIGAGSFVFETDASGSFVGSSYCYATARDWAKLGQLYLNEGNWDGKQILDTSWIAFSQTPAPDSQKRYGGHFWLNADKHLPDCPDNMYYMDGFQGQRVFILPRQKLVIVRLGVAYDTKKIDFNGFVSAIAETCEH